MSAEHAPRDRPRRAAGPYYSRPKTWIICVNYQECYVQAATNLGTYMYCIYGRRRGRGEPTAIYDSQEFAMARVVALGVAKPMTSEYIDRRRRQHSSYVPTLLVLGHSRYSNLSRQDIMETYRWNYNLYGGFSEERLL